MPQRKKILVHFCPVVNYNSIIQIFSARSNGYRKTGKFYFTSATVTVASDAINFMHPIPRQLEFDSLLR